MKKFILTLVFISSCCLASSINAEPRFPQPEFESNYEIKTHIPAVPQSSNMEYIDLLVLVVAISLASFLAIKARSRKALFILAIFSLVYFGFYRNGCICPVGSLQNIIMALFDRSYTLPITVLAIFLLPLLFTLFFGRTFCSGVCPLGAIQEITILKPIKLSPAIANALKLIPYIYLGIAVLVAATSSSFVICQLDPFVSIFRMTGEAPNLKLGALFLIVGLFVARPYCRFFCPYGVLLNWMSRFSKHHLTITPSECVQCKLCSDSCPVDVIRKPIPAASPEPIASGITRLKMYILLLPVLVILCGLIGSRLETPLAKLDNTVILAEQILAENNGVATETTLRSEAFRAEGQSTDELFDAAVQRRSQLRFGGWVLGGFIGLVIGFKLIGYSTRRRSKDYKPDRAECYSCARCIPYCPVKSTEETIP